MSENEIYKVKFEYRNPENVESQVPGEQKLREPNPNESGSGEEKLDEIDKEIQIFEETTLAPVLTVTKNEAVFTKGDLKLQKITVSEDISKMPKNGGVYRTVNPVYSSVHGEVIQTQALRISDDADDEGVLVNREFNDHAEHKKMRTRIPKFKDTVEKMRRERRDSGGKRERKYSEETKEIPKPQVRSSIPKPRSKLSTHAKSDEKDVKIKAEVLPTPVKRELLENYDKSFNNEIENNVNDIKKQDNYNLEQEQEPEDLFDKIYDEILETNEQDANNDNVTFVETVDDPKSLEMSFDEIVHDYEENKMEPLDVDQIKSRLLVKQKSLHDIEIGRPKQVERRFSLKDIQLDERNSKKPVGDTTDNDNTDTHIAKPGSVKKVKKIEWKPIRSKIVPPKIVSKKESPEKQAPADKVDTKISKIKTSDHKRPTMRTLEDQVETKSAKNIKETVKVVKPVFDKKEQKKTEHITKKLQQDRTETEFKPKTIPETISPEVIEEEKPIPESNYNPKLDSDKLNTGIPDSTQMVRNLTNKQNDEIIMISRPISHEPKEVTEENADVHTQKQINDEPKIDSDNSKQENVGNDYKTENKVKPILRGKVSRIINKIDSSDTKPPEAAQKDHFNETPKKKSVLSRIATLTSDKPRKDHENNDVAEPNKVTDDRVNDQTKDNKYNVAQNQQKHFENTPHLKEVDQPLSIIEVPSEIHEKQHGKHEVSDYVYNNKGIINKSPEAEQVHLPTESETNKEHTDYVNVAENTHKDVSPLDDTKESSENVFYDGKEQTQPDFSENIEDNDVIPLLKGKVSRIINRIDSHDESTVQIPKKDITQEIPVKKSVSSRIAMFERQTTQEPSKPKIESRLPKFVKENDNKPKIIHEVLKPKPLDTLEPTPEPIFKVEQIITIPIVETIENSKDIVIEKSPENSSILKEANVLYPEAYENSKIIEDTNKSKEPIDAINLKANENELDTVNDFKQDNVLAKLNDDKYSNSHRPLLENDNKDYPHQVPTKFDKDNKLRQLGRDLRNQEFAPPRLEKDRYTREKISRERVSNQKDDRNEDLDVEFRKKRIEPKEELRRSKSVAELDLGDAVKGKVHKLIVRINSFENLDVEYKPEERKKEEVISVKERPRKRSVSEKIALFERKLTPVRMADPVTPASKTSSKTNLTPVMSEEELQQKVAELTNAKVKYGRMESMGYIQLANGVDMPVLSVGTALLPPGLIGPVIGAAIDLGYRGVDCAYIYGNEKAVGEAIRAKIQDGTVTREELYITSKLWSTFHRRDLVEQACRDSLDAMGLDYFDLYLIHNPMSFKEGGDAIPKIANVIQYSESDYLDAWFGMEGLVSKGLALSIGVSNFNSVQLARVHEKGRVKPTINQVECHPYLSQQRLDLFCVERNVKLACYGVLGSKGTPADLKSHQTAVIDDPLVQVMAAGLQVSPAQLLLRYQIECGHSVVVKAASASHLWDNLQALKFTLTAAQIDALHALNRNKRTYTFKGMGDTHRNYPFRIPY